MGNLSFSLDLGVANGTVMCDVEYRMRFTLVFDVSPKHKKCR